MESEKIQLVKMKNSDSPSTSQVKTIANYPVNPQKNAALPLYQIVSSAENKTPHIVQEDIKLEMAIRGNPILKNQNKEELQD